MSDFVTLCIVIGWLFMVLTALGFVSGIGR